MKSTVENAYAKINISLDVTGKRPDGYHDMLMVMQSVTLCDELYLTLTDNGVCRAECNLRFVPCDERNLAVRAAKLFFAHCGLESMGVHIAINKRIPVGAGMAGGSSDAAAVLRALNRLTGQGLSCSELEELASQIGSDVAFCIAGGTRLASGRGDILSPLPSLPNCHIVICKPDFSVSTPESFRKLDSVRLRCHPDTAGILDALDGGELAQIARRMYNVFEDIPDRRHSDIARIKGLMLDHGALGSVMTGTGSAVFGLFDDPSSAKTAQDALSHEYRSCFLAKNMPRLDV